MHRDAEGYDWNDGEPDHEGEMAVSQLHRIAEMAEMLLDIIGENDELPGWIQYKFSRAYNDLNDAFGYIESRSHEIHDEYDDDEEVDFEDDYEGEFDDEEYDDDDVMGMDEAKKKGLWANVHAKRKRGGKPAKPGDKNYPDKKSWDTAVASGKNESIIRKTIRDLVKKELKG